MRVTLMSKLTSDAHNHRSSRFFPVHVRLLDGLSNTVTQVSQSKLLEKLGCYIQYPVYSDSLLFLPFFVIL